MARSGIDVNLVVEVEHADAAERAERRLASLGLGSAWVSPREACVNEPDAYDERLEAAFDAATSLLPVPVIVPPTGDPGAYERARRVADNAAVRVVRLCPAGHGYPLADWVLSPLPELCEREGLAVVIDFASEPIPWPAVLAFARTFPTLALVLLGVAVGEDRALPAALDAAPNLVFALGRLRSADDLARLCETFGASRFVFGTDERADPAAALAAVAALGDEARDAVLQGNAEALAAGTYAEASLT